MNIFIVMCVFMQSYSNELWTVLFYMKKRGDFFFPSNVGEMVTLSFTSIGSDSTGHPPHQKRADRLFLYFLLLKFPLSITIENFLLVDDRFVGVLTFPSCFPWPIIYAKHLWRSVIPKEMLWVLVEGELRWPSEETHDTTEIAVACRMPFCKCALVWKHEGDFSS